MVKAVQVPQHKGMRQGTTGICHKLDVLHLAFCISHILLYWGGNRGTIIHIAPGWGYELVRCAFSKCSTEKSMVLAANHSAAVVIVALKAFLDGVEHIEIYKRDEEQGKSYNTVKFLHKSWSQ